MTTEAEVHVDIADVIRGFHAVKINVHKAVPKLISRLSLKGEGFMKHESPYRTGTLRRSIHAHPTTLPVSVATGVNYAFAANIRSRRPGFIGKTVEHIEKILPHESEIVIKNALKGMDK